IISARRPGVIANLAVRRVGNLNQLAIRQRDDIDLAILIGKSNALAVRRPLGLITHGAPSTPRGLPAWGPRPAAGDLLGGLQTILRCDIQLLFAAGVGDVSDAAAIRRPGRPLVMSAGRMRQVARRTFFNWRREDVAARGKKRAFAFGTQANRLNITCR